MVNHRNNCLAANRGDNRSHIRDDTTTYSYDIIDTNTTAASTRPNAILDRMIVVDDDWEEEDKLYEMSELELEAANILLENDLMNDVSANAPEGIQFNKIVHSTASKEILKESLNRIELKSLRREELEGLLKNTLKRVGGFHCFAELDIAFILIKRRLSISDGDAILEVLKKNCKCPQNRKMRNSFKSIMNVLKNKALSSTRIEYDNRLLNIMDTTRYVVKEIIFDHPHCTPFVITIRHMDWGYLMHTFLDHAFDNPGGPLFPSDNKPKFNDPDYVYTDLHSGKHWWNIKALYRKVMRDSLLQCVPAILMKDATDVSGNNVGICNIFAANALVPFEDRNKHVLLVAIFPEKEFLKHITCARDSVHVSNISKCWRSAFYDCLLSDPGIVSTSGSRGFDFYNQVPTLYRGNKYVLILVVLPTDW